MKRRNFGGTDLGLLSVVALIATAGCSSSSDEEPPSPQASTQAEAQAWNLGNKLSLAAVGYVEQAPQSAVDGVMKEAQQIASELGTEIAPLPARTGNRVQDGAAVLNYLLKTAGLPIKQSLESQHGRRQSLLFQISLRANLLLLLYSPPPNNSESLALVSFLSEKAGEAELPRELLLPLANQVRAGLPYEQVKIAVQEFQTRTASHLAKRGGSPSGNGGSATKTSPALQPATPPAGNDPPPPPAALGVGEQYLRDLQPTSVVALPEGFEHHFDREFEVQKVVFKNGVYFCPPTERSTGRAVYELEQGYTRLKGGTAISEHRFKKAWSPVTFRIIGDGKVLWASRPLQMCGEWEAFDVDLTGLKQLALEVECTGPHTGAHGSWMDPVLVER